MYLSLPDVAVIRQDIGRPSSVVLCVIQMQIGLRTAVFMTVSYTLWCTLLPLLSTHNESGHLKAQFVTAGMRVEAAEGWSLGSVYLLPSRLLGLGERRKLHQWRSGGARVAWQGHKSPLIGK